MITKIEINNFQSHKHTVIDFDKGVNVICGETDNGKSAVIRAIRWVVENNPQGTTKINSRWNNEFKEPMSVTLFTDKGKIERIRSKIRNGYNIYKNDSPPIELDAIGKTVPEEVLQFLNISDVNFQYQFDSPYLLSLTPGQASQYLNEIVHLDSIDKIMSVADSNKRQLSSEQKVVENDIKKLEKEAENYTWVDEADNLYLRTKKLNSIIQNIIQESDNLEQSIEQFKKQVTVDLTEPMKLIQDIESIKIEDCSELEESINSYNACSNVIVDITEAKKLVESIDSIIICNTDELQKSLISYHELNGDITRISSEIETLKDSLPERCPYCNNIIDKDCLCS